MKIRNILLIVAASLFATAASAQVDKTIEFVDAEGNVVPDGSTITVTDVETDPFTGEPYQIISGLYVRNNSSEEVGAKVEVNVSRLDNGSLPCCFPSLCSTITSVGTTETEPGTMEGSKSQDFQTEWVFGGYGTCTATFRLKLMDVEYNSWGIPTKFTDKADGPSVTVNFVYSDPTGIDKVGITETSEITGIYTIGGQKAEKLQKGINIVKYSNGKSAKIIVK